MSFGIGGAVLDRQPGAAGSYDPLLVTAAADQPDWARYADTILGIFERAVPIWERVDAEERRRRHELELERLRQWFGQFPVEPVPGRIEVRPVPQPLPAWVWVVAGVGGIAAVLLLVQMLKR